MIKIYKDKADKYQQELTNDKIQKSIFYKFSLKNFKILINS